MDLVTCAEMREMDRLTIEGGLVPSLTLMERAGQGVLRSLLRRCPGLHQSRVVILCGRGNNGGDGFVLARLLRDRGAWPEVWLTEPRASLGGDAAVNAARLEAAGLWIREAGAKDRARLSSLSSRDVVVDALLGTGIKGPVRGEVREWILAINQSPARVLAVDLPSGLTADGGLVEGEAVRADWTVTMGFAKQGFLFPPARGMVGPVDIVDLGIPPEVREKAGVSAQLPEAGQLASWLPAPGSGSHKGDWGKLVIVGGSPGLTGAPFLAARAALRTGSGLVRIGLPRSLNPILEEKLTEAMTILLPEGEEGQLLASGADRILSGFGDWDALVLGPGLGRSPEGDRLVMRLLGGWRGPLLIDADALNALAAWGPDSWVARAREIRAAGEPGGVVLTPHLGEMARLTGRPVRQLAARPIEETREWAVRWGVTLVLKGAPSCVGAPDGRVWVNPTGNSGLATGGSGDVLSGVIGALLGQGLSGPKAAVLGAYLHGLTADLLVRGRAKRSLLPGDVAESLGMAVRHLEDREEPPGWLWEHVG